MSHSHHHHHHGHHPASQETPGNPFWTLLHRTHASELSSKKAVVTLKSNDTVETAVRTLAEKKIHAAPVVDHKDQSQVVGLVDVLDIVAFIIRVAPDVRSINENELRSLEMCGRAMALAELQEILDASGRDPYMPIYEDSPATFVADVLAQGVHRVPLFANGSASLSAIVSQTDVIRFIHSKAAQGGELYHACEKTLSNACLSYTTVFSVTSDQTVLSALKTLDDKRVSALAVVDVVTGRLTGNFSASDLSGLFQDQFPSLLLSVGEYLAKFSPNSLKPCVILPSASIKTVLDELVENQTHRLWVVDDNFRPQGVVTQTDLLKFFHDYTQ